jgi:hypothetical protein
VVTITAGVAITGSVIARDHAAQKAFGDRRSSVREGRASTADARVQDRLALDRSAPLPLRGGSLIDGVATRSRKTSGWQRSARSHRRLDARGGIAPVLHVRLRHTADGHGLQPVSMTPTGSRAEEAFSRRGPAEEGSERNDSPADVSSHREPEAKGSERNDSPVDVRAKAGEVGASGVTAGEVGAPGVTAGEVGASGGPASSERGEGQPSGQSDGHNDGQVSCEQGSYEQSSHGQARPLGPAREPCGEQHGGD